MGRGLCNPEAGPGRTLVTMRAASDDTLLASFALGDPDAAAAFIRRYQGRVYGLARTMLGDADLAEDVAQEAFIRAWRHAPAYDSRRARCTHGCW